MVVSTLFAVSVALIVFFIQQQEADLDNRQKQLDLVTLELANLRSNLHSADRVKFIVDEKVFFVQLFQHEPITLEQAAKSGLFNKDQSWQLIDFSQSVRNWNFKVALAVSIMNEPSTDSTKSARLEWINKNIIRSQAGLLKGVDILEEKLKIKIPNNIREY